MELEGIGEVLNMLQQREQLLSALAAIIAIGGFVWTIMHFSARHLRRFIFVPLLKVLGQKPRAAAITG